MDAESFLSALSGLLPGRAISHENGPYLSRFTLTETDTGGHVYLHFFHRSDADLELHNHPWAGTSLILTGGYREERRFRGGIETRIFRPGDVNVLMPDTFHRVDLLDPAAGCWTLFVTGQRVQDWGFWDRYTDVFTPWKEALRKRGLLP